MSQDGEVVSRQAHNLKNGSSNLPPAPNNLTTKMFFLLIILNHLCDKSSENCSYFICKEIYRKEIKGNGLCN